MQYGGRRGRLDLSAYGDFAVGLVTLAVGWIAWAWRKRTATDEDEDVSHLADLLAIAVSQQWTREADKRGW